MDNIYQQKVEQSLNKALPDIAYYLSIGLITGSLLETILPEINDEKDSISLLLEIFAQITLIIFIFMFINSKGGVRNGIIVFILALIGTQPTLFLKMNKLKDKVLGTNKPDVKNNSDQEHDSDKEEEDIEEEENNTEENNNFPEEEFQGSTSIHNLPIN